MSAEHTDKHRSERTRAPLVLGDKYKLPTDFLYQIFKLLDIRDAPDDAGKVKVGTLKLAVAVFDSTFNSADIKDRITIYRQSFGIARHPDEIRELVRDLCDQEFASLRDDERRAKCDEMENDDHALIPWEHPRITLDTEAEELDLFEVRLRWQERVYFTIDMSENSTILSRIISFAILGAIIVSTVNFMLATHPNFQQIPENCDPLQHDKLCEPSTIPMLDHIERLCMYMFSMEYLVKLVVVFKVRFELLNLHYLEDVFLKGTEASKERRVTPQLDSTITVLTKWILSPWSVVDLLAVLPFWIEELVPNAAAGMGSLAVLRILRLTRIFRIAKMGQYSQVFSMLQNTMRKSIPMIVVMFAFLLMSLCIFGCMVWFTDRGQWYPPESAELIALGIGGRGGYLRDTSIRQDGSQLEESPFLSIPHSFWWVIVTVTTVGYGDNFPVTRMGRLVGAVTIVTGVVILAMPIGVIGANFSAEFERIVSDDLKRKKKQKEKEELERGHQDQLERRGAARKGAETNELEREDPILLAARTAGNLLVNLLDVDVTPGLKEANLGDVGYSQISAVRDSVEDILRSQLGDARHVADQMLVEGLLFDGLTMIRMLEQTGERNFGLAEQTAARLRCLLFSFGKAYSEWVLKQSSLESIPTFVNTPLERGPKLKVQRTLTSSMMRSAPTEMMPSRKTAASEQNDPANEDEVARLAAVVERVLSKRTIQTYGPSGGESPWAAVGKRVSQMSQMGAASFQMGPMAGEQQWPLTGDQAAAISQASGAGFSLPPMPQVPQQAPAPYGQPPPLHQAQGGVWASHATLG